MNKNSQKIRKMTGIAIFTAVTVALAFFGNYITFGPVSINLALIAIAVGACIYGPVAGLFLGMVDGAIIMIAPSTLTAFMPYNPWATVIVCLVKTGAAGLAAGFIYKGLSHIQALNNSKWGWVKCLITSIAIPVINTGLFIAGAELWFVEVYGGGKDAMKAIITSCLTINFVIEMVTVVVLSPAVHGIVKYATNRLLDNNEENDEVEETSY
jgi:uncharacterized membrane protein